MTPTPVTLFTDHIIPTPLRASLPLENRPTADPFQVGWASPTKWRLIGPEYSPPSTLLGCPLPDARHTGQIAAKFPGSSKRQVLLGTKLYRTNEQPFSVEPTSMRSRRRILSAARKIELCRPGTRTTPSPALPLRRSLGSSRSFRLPALEPSRWQQSRNHIRNYVHIVHEERRPAGLPTGNRYQLKLRLKTT